MKIYVRVYVRMQSLLCGLPAASGYRTEMTQNKTTKMSQNPA